jgi:hypothetical protein
MVKILLIQKTGELSSKNINTVDLDNLYKKASFRNGNDFDWRACWPYKDSFITLYSKNGGRSSTINKYDLPPPVDNELYYGTMICLKHDNIDIKQSNVFNDLTVEEWEKCYEKLFGGFEALGADDSFSSEEEIDPELLTKDGYKKDGFVVSDEEDNDYIEDQDDDDIDDVDDGDDVDGDDVDDEEQTLSKADDDETEEEYETDEIEFDSEGDAGSELSEEGYLSD